VDKSFVIQSAQKFAATLVPPEPELDFILDEVVEIELDPNIPVKAIERRAGISRVYWEFLGEQVAGAKHRVKLAVGRFNKPTNDEAVVAWIAANPERKLAGSGAWAREGFLKAVPRYDGKGLIRFVADLNSRWHDRQFRRVFFPVLWVVERDWHRPLSRVDHRFDADSRVAPLIVE